MTTFWLGAAALTLLAVSFLVIPLRREWRHGRKPLGALVTALAVVPVSVGLYLSVTTFEPDADAHGGRQERAVIEQLAARLEQDPSDVEGWQLLGRSYMQLGDYASARSAFEQAFKRTARPDDALKVGYAESLLYTDPGSALAMAGDLIDQVLETSPDNQRALWWGGFIAAERNQPSLAVDRWTALLATNPPPEVADVIRTQLIALAGDSGQAPAAAAAGTTSTQAQAPLIEMDVSVGADIDLDDFGPNAILWIIARSPESPMPIAVRQVPLTALPGHFSLGEGDSLMPNRSLGQYDTVSIVARISASGQPTEQSGDAYAEGTAMPGSGETLELVIDQRVP